MNFSSLPILLFVFATYIFKVRKGKTCLHANLYYLNLWREVVHLFNLFHTQLCFELINYRSKPYTPLWWVIKIRKCGVDSVYLLKVVERPDQNKRYNAPHLDSMGYMHREMHSHIAIQEMSDVRLIPWSRKLPHFQQG